MNRLLFGTAGTPHSATKRSTVSGVQRIRALGLDCMEVEFVRGVRMGEGTAQLVRETATKEGVHLSVHAPYYINLNSAEKSKVKASVERIIHSAKIGSICGARSIVFHPGFYMENTKSAVYNRVRERLKEIQSTLKSDGVNVVLRPETTGKRTQFGSLLELLTMSLEVEGVLPCIDFSHLHAREGRINSAEEFREVFVEIENTLGRVVLDDMHIHLSGIEYTRKGERNHLDLDDSDLQYQELLDVWNDFNLKGLVICESPNLEGDALLLQKTYHEN